MLNDVLKLRNRGLSVFPVSNKSKVPMVEWDRLQDQLPSLDEVTKWFTPNNRSVGIATGPVSGILLLDFDFAKHPEAREFLKSVAIPLTWKEQTASGGLHFYFRWIEILNTLQTNTTSVIFNGVDTKGYGGYSKITPSLGYKWINPPHSTVLALPPQWLIDKLSEREKVKSLTNTEGWLEKALEEMKVGNIDDTLVRILGKMRNENWTEEAAFLCLQPLALSRGATENHVKEKIENIWRRYEPTKVDEKSSANSIDQFLENIEQVEWLCEPIVAKKTIGFTAGLPETMKTWIMIDLAIESARGGGMWLNRFPVKAAKVLFIDQERFKGETQRRFRAVITAKNLNPKDLRGSLFIRCGTTTRINLQPSYDAFRKELSEIRPDLVIIDSFAAFHTAEENSRQSIQEVLEKIKQLRSEFGCAFIFIHHENKFAFRGKEEDREPSIAEMSGSVAIPAVAEFVLTVRRQDSESSFVYHTKSTLASTISPFLVKVVDLDDSKSAIKVEAY